VLVVADDSSGGSAIHTPGFVTAARSLGLRTRVVTWRIERRPPAIAVAAARRFRADAVFVSAGYPPYLARLIHALRTALGPRLPIIGTDYFEAEPGIWRSAGGAAAGRVYISVIGVPNARLPAAGLRYLARFDPRTPSFGAAYAAQAADVLLDAIARSDGTRATVLRELHATDLRDGILGRIRFDRFGDLRDGPIAILRLRRGARAAADPMFAHTVVDRVITPPPSLVP
jgi:ABC-type branched-subunit amino acid transport system substrate-binding protein